MSRMAPVVELHVGDKNARKMVDLELEAQVIGAVLADPGAFKYCADLANEHFSDPVHAELWQTICGMMFSSRSATAATIALELGDEHLDAIGGRRFLSGLVAMGAALGPAIGSAAAQLRELGQWRRVAALHEEIGQRIRGRSMMADEMISMIMRESEVILQIGRSTARTKREVAKSAIEEIMNAPEPVPTGIDALDFLTHGGLRPKFYLGIKGLFGIGKTILAGTISSNLNIQGEKHMVLLLENSPESVEIRDCARHLKINAGQLRDEDDPDHQVFLQYAETYAEKVPNNSLYEYEPGADISKIERLIIRAVHRHGIKGVIIDYWQEIEGKERGETEDAHLRKCAKRLRRICERENIWCILLAQCDENGKSRYCESGLEVSCTLVVRLVREENDDVAFFVTEKSNYSRYADAGSKKDPSVAFDLAGPHFANLTAADRAALSEKMKDDVFKV